MSACTNCRYIVATKEKVCPRCQSELSDRYSGLIVILDPNNSEVAKTADINVKGNFAIRVK